ncbi:MAG: T9SS type A sorting domain-containing protein [Thermoanaerobaculia bacterium]|nr:T9SS type A sorting domain-containing protein [Thermoanaerobaculia bacterium]
MTAGTYIVTVTDVAGCTAVLAVTVEQISDVVVTADVTHVTCNGGSDGAVDLTINGGLEPYQIDWAHLAGVSNPEDLSNLQAGNYAATITDANGCNAFVSATIVQPTMVLSTTTTAVSCNGGNDGAIDLTASGGVSPYSFQWNNGSGDEDPGGLTAGTYCVTVTDANGCTKTTCATVVQPTALSLSVSASPATCNGSATGGINLSVSGGTPAYAYQWDNGAITQDLTGITAGTYCVTVTDANGCTKTICATVTQPSVLQATAIAIDDACFNQSNGDVSLSVSGGTQPYLYLWSNGITGQNLANIPAGKYCVTVTDANGCTVSSCATVPENPEIILSVTTVNVSCFGGNNGKVNLTVSGGTPGYSYQWSNNSGAQNLNNVQAGTYCVTVTDASGCTRTTCATVGQPADLNPTGQVTNVSCFGGNNGAIDLSVTGGTQPYAYQWSPGNVSTQDRSNLTVGTYSVTVTDANGCTKKQTFQVTQPTQINLSTQLVMSPLCSGNYNVNTTVFGGTPPYTYQWSTGWQLPNLFQVPSGAAYCVTVTDAKGCQKTTCVDIPQYEPITASAAVTPIKCYGTKTGKIDQTVTGGAGTPYTFYWNSGILPYTEDQQNIGSGIYEVTITDPQGCTLKKTYIVGGPSFGITPSTTVVNASCGLSNGSIDLKVIGGTPQMPGSIYSYAWSNGATTQDLNNIPAGTYCVTITDFNGCTKTNCATVTDQPGPALTIAATDATCGALNGAINLTPGGGLPPYSFLWSNGAVTEDLANLAAGTYCVTVTDARNCTSVACAAVNNAGAPVLTLTPAHSTCGNPNGSVDLALTGGTTPFTFLWSNGVTIEDPSGLSAGNYCVTVTDLNGCVAVACTTITTSGNPVLFASVTNANIGLANGAIDLTTIGGTPPFNYVWTTGATTEDLTNLDAGTYCVTVSDAFGCTATVCATVELAGGLELSVIVNNELCGVSAGSINLTTQGGVPPFTYLWSTGATTEDLANVNTGVYCVTVTDDSGDTATTCATVNSTGGPELTVTTTNANCALPTGSVNLTVTGGLAPFSFLWSNGATSEDLASLKTGTYCVTVTDASGCAAIICASVYEFEGVSLMATVMNSSCNWPTGAIDLKVFGGTPPYQYLWSNDSTTQDVSGLSSGVYQVTVTDQTGCSATSSATVNNGAAPTLTAVITNNTCLQSNGLINLTVSGGGVPYTYLWSNGATTQDLANLNEGEYCVTVTDAANCTSVECYNLSCMPPDDCSSLKVSAALAVGPTCVAANARVIVNVNNGIGGYAYTWVNTSANASGEGSSVTEPFIIDSLASGVFRITLTDASGCTAVAVTAIDPPSDHLILTAQPDTSSNCTDHSANIIVDLQNGSPAYTYQWENLNSNENGTGTAALETFLLEGLASGTYAITVTDAQGCSGTVAANISPWNIFHVHALPSGAACDSVNLEIAVIVDNGSPSFFYEWHNGSTQGSGSPANSPFAIGGLDAGAYSLMIVDNNGCMDTLRFELGKGFEGKVYNDYNTDGIHGNNEPGLSAVKVYLYACDVVNPVDSVLTDASGNYRFSLLDQYPYRLEFVPAQPWLVPAIAGTNNNTSVQFIHSGDCIANAGFYNPDDYCQISPAIAYTAFTPGLASLTAQTAVGLFPYNAVDQGDLLSQVPASERIGSVYGLAWDRSRNYLYAGAFLKRHTGLGELGLGGIYRIDYSGATPVVTSLYTVPDAGAVDRPDLSDETTPNRDSDAFAKVGKTGLGDVDISPDYQTLWTVNLHSRNLVRIDSILGSNPVSAEIAINSAPDCPGGVFRPFGLKAYRGKIYVGGVCTGENNGAAADLSASVHEYDISTQTWKQVLEFGLTGAEYDRGDIIANADPDLAQCKEWESWTDTYSERNWVANTAYNEPADIIPDGNFEIVGDPLGDARYRCRGQAMVADIEFTREGLILIGLTDRTGHQLGYRQLRPDALPGDPVSAVSAGDILVAYEHNGVWALEQNGHIQGLNRNSQYGVGNSEGPGGGEFVFGNARFLHQDADAGGLVYLPGTNEVLSVVVSPASAASVSGGGVAWYNPANGGNTRNDLTLVEAVPHLTGPGRANPVGDLEALCDDPPIQIGNRVWADENCNGVQDACEPPLEGVWVSLYLTANHTLLAYTQTNDRGEYYFTGLGTPGEYWTDTPGFDSITPGTAYTIVFGKGDTSSQFSTTASLLLLGNINYSLSTANAGHGYHPDLNDSDAVPDSTDQDKPWYRYPVIHYITGIAGFSDHSLDAGFCPDTLKLSACEAPPGSGQAIFDLPEASDLVDPDSTYLLSWHSTPGDAETGNAPLPDMYTATDNTVVFARLSNQGSGVLATIKMVILTVLHTPVAHHAELWSCIPDSTGTGAVFTLTDADHIVSNGQNGLNITYHTEYADAYNGLDTLPRQFSSTTRNIWVRVENESGCFDIDFVSLTVTSGPQVTLLPKNCTCTNGVTDGSIDATVHTGVPPFRFEWSNGVQHGPAIDSVFTLDNLPAGTYTLTLTDANGCTSVATATVASGSAPEAIFSIGVEQACEGPFTVIFTDLSTGNPDSWDWSFPGGMPASSTEQYPVISYAASGIYQATLTVTNAGGSSTLTLPVEVVAAPLPQADFNFTVHPDGKVDFTNLSQFGNNYTWDFGDGTTSTDADPSHVYTKPGIYTVTLTAFNVCGSSEIQQEVHIITVSTKDHNNWLESFLLYPNPNTGTFLVEMTGEPEREIRFLLYNALGQLMKTETVNFSTGNLKHTFRYRELPAAVYMLHIRAGDKWRAERVIIQ